MFEDVLNVSIDYLSVALRLTKSGTVTRLFLLGFRFPDFFGVDLVDGSFLRGKGLT